MKLGPGGFFEFSFEELTQIIRSFFSFLKLRKKNDKTTAFILFIDDEKFPVVENLEKGGWSVKRKKDVENLQDEDIIRAHIIFVDYKGVGKTLSESDEGIGIIKAIKEKYHNKKRVILYSGYGNFSLGKHLGVADNQMSKNSDTYEFISMIESELARIS